MSKGKEEKICHFCGKGKTVGGAWLSKREPTYFSDRKLWVECKGDMEPMHSLCRLLELKGLTLDKKTLQLIGKDGKIINENPITRGGLE